MKRDGLEKQDTWLTKDDLCIVIVAYPKSSRASANTVDVLPVPGGP